LVSGVAPFTGLSYSIEKLAVDALCAVELSIVSAVETARINETAFTIFYV